MKLLLNVFLGLIVFLAIEDKPFFLYIIPSIVAVTIAYMAESDDKQGVIECIRLIGKETFLAISIAVIISLVYLGMARTTSEERYLWVLIAAVKPSDFINVIENMISYMTNFEKFSIMVYESRMFRLPNIILSLTVWSFGLGFLVMAYRVTGRSLPRKLSLPQ
jgi:hypothetical protein